MTGAALGNNGNSGPHPVTKYCMVTPITLEIIQYSESPLGKPVEKNPNMMGIIHSIMFWVDCCFGSRA